MKRFWNRLAALAQFFYGEHPSDISVHDAGFAMRTQTWLLAHGYNTLGDIADDGILMLLSQKHCGPVVANDVAQTLRKQGIELLALPVAPLTTYVIDATSHPAQER